ncbi:MAG: hypothetical protein WB998_12345, partial [Solirubrobacteraceae bacterium]
AGVALADALISRDLAAASGRIAGWRSARGLEHREAPREALDREIGMRESLALRRGIYAPRTSTQSD